MSCVSFYFMKFNEFYRFPFCKIIEIYLEFGAAHNSMGSVVILSNESPQQRTIIMIISTIITGIGCFAQKIPIRMNVISSSRFIVDPSLKFFKSFFRASSLLWFFPSSISNAFPNETFDFYHVSTHISI